MAYPLEHSIDVNDVFSELNPSRIGLGRLRCAPANRRDKYEFVTLPKRITLFYVLLINGKGMRLGQTNQPRISSDQTIPNLSRRGSLRDFQLDAVLPNCLTIRSKCSNCSPYH